MSGRQQQGNMESVVISTLAILLGLLLGAVIMMFGGYDPIAAYQALFSKSFGDIYGIGETIRQITPLIFTGLSVAFAYRTGLFNIGAEGQFVIGMLVATFVGITIKLPPIIHAVVAVLAAGLAAGLWGWIAGALKAKRGVHEVISTIMLNWIALYLANYVVQSHLLEPGQQRSKFVAKSSWLSSQTISDWFDHARIHFGTVIALLAAYCFYLILWKMKQGFELRAVGFNPHAGEYAGMSVGKNVMMSMLISGFFAGLGGAAEVLGVFHYEAVLTSSPGYGFLGIAVALLGRNTAIGTVMAAALLGILTFGAPGMKFGAGVPVELINIVIALVIFFVAASGIFSPVLKLFRGTKRKEDGHGMA